jgi:hypothetical protein
LRHHSCDFSVEAPAKVVDLALETTRKVQQPA